MEQTAGTGRIVRIEGSVVDIRFDADAPPVDTCLVVGREGGIVNSASAW